MKYLDKLSDPRWAKKRAKIFKRDRYRCTACGSDENLQVHHTYYVNGADPWAYSDESLLTLCEKCHHEYHEYHELTILPKFVRKKNKKPNHKRRKKKQLLPKEPSKGDKLRAKTTLRHPTYRKCINGVWFNFEVEY